MSGKRKGRDSEIAYSGIITQLSVSLQVGTKILNVAVQPDSRVTYKYMRNELFRLGSLL